MCFCISSACAVVNDGLQRGEHDIEHEISFRSNDRFVFHDSRGFEAGSEDELHQVQSFIEERAKAERLSKRLHAIWFKSSLLSISPHSDVVNCRYCIPMSDHNRPITVAEETFFSTCGTGKGKEELCFDGVLSFFQCQSLLSSQNVMHCMRLPSVSS